MDITGKKVVMIIPPIDFRDEELHEPKELLEKAGLNVTVASHKTLNCRGILGSRYTADILVDEFVVEETDIIIFVGGPGASFYWDNNNMHRICAEAIKHEKILCAISYAPVILARAGVLSNKRATVWKSEHRELSSRGAFYTGKRVEFDNKIITAEGPESATQFARSIIKELQGAFL